MKLTCRITIAILALPLLTVCLLQPATAQTPSASESVPLESGQHDFDFEIGSWKIHLKRLLKPLTGSSHWVEYDGTSVTRPIWEGRANLEEFETDGTGGHVEGLTLRLYDPVGKQWSLYWVNSKDGNLGVPTVGAFKNGFGEFYDFEKIGERLVWVRYQWSQITSRSAHFEQAFSIDGGRTWEVNWITDQNRIE